MKFSELFRYYHGGQLEIMQQMSRQEYRGSAGEYQADEQAGVARLTWRQCHEPVSIVLQALCLSDLIP